MEPWGQSQSPLPGSERRCGVCTDPLRTAQGAGAGAHSLATEQRDVTKTGEGGTRGTHEPLTKWALLRQQPALSHSCHQRGSDLPQGNTWPGTQEMLWWHWGLPSCLSSGRRGTCVHLKYAVDSRQRGKNNGQQFLNPYNIVKLHFPTA